MRSRSSRTSALDDIGDQMAPVGSEPWAKWMLGQAKLRRHDLQVDVVGLQDLIRKLEKHGAWKALGFVSFEMLCLKELDLDEEEVELVKTAKKGRALGAVIETAKKAKPLAAHGGDRKSENADQGDNVTLKARGNAPDYLTARIARDRPDIQDRVSFRPGLALPQLPRFAHATISPSGGFRDGGRGRRELMRKRLPLGGNV